MSVEKRKNKTPSDGVMSEAYFLNNNWESSEKEKAKMVIIRELDKDGNLVNEIYGRK